MYKHILLPTDGSALSGEAIRSGVAFARSIGARVTGLYVILDTQVAAGTERAALPAEDDAVAGAEEFLRVINDEARRGGVPHESFHVRADAPYEAIIGTAEAKGCDLIFMASHGRRGMAGLLLGSETMHVLTHCKIPVLVYR